ncbi:hypothetical protein D3C78_1957460 [compost metagenome]
MLGDVLGSATVGSGQLVGVFQADALDQGLQRVRQLRDVDAAEVWQVHRWLPQS